MWNVWESLGLELSAVRSVVPFVNQLEAEIVLDVVRLVSRCGGLLILKGRIFVLQQLLACNSPEELYRLGGTMAATRYHQQWKAHLRPFQQKKVPA